MDRRMPSRAMQASVDNHRHVSPDKVELVACSAVQSLREAATGRVRRVRVSLGNWLSKQCARQLEWICEAKALEQIQMVMVLEGLVCVDMGCGCG